MRSFSVLSIAVALSYPRESHVTSFAWSAFVPVRGPPHVAKPLMATSHYAEDHYAEDLFYHDKRFDFSSGAPKINMERMVKCAESKIDCSVREMRDMITGTCTLAQFVPVRRTVLPGSSRQCRLHLLLTLVISCPIDLEQLNHDCNHLLSDTTECDLEQVEGREVLKQALTLKRDLDVLNEKMRGIKSLNAWRRKQHPVVQSNGVEDHSFSHYVDYRDIGAYESH